MSHNKTHRKKEETMPNSSEPIVSLTAQTSPDSPHAVEPNLDPTPDPQPAKDNKLKRLFKKDGRFSYTRASIFGLAFAIIAAIVLKLSFAATPACAALGQSITSCIAQPGGQELIIPDGTYTGGSISAPHSDWLILKAQDQGKVTIDLSKTGLKLNAGTNKVVFVGMKFVNGMIATTGAKDIDFWYTEHTFAPEIWTQQYKALGGTTITTSNCSAMLSIRSKMANPFPTALRGATDNNTSSPTYGQKSNIGWYGADIHNTGDDAVFLDGSDNTKFIGTKFWHITQNGTGTANPSTDFNIGPTSLDPADANKVACPNLDWWHNDGVQNSAGSGLTLTDDSWDRHPFLGGDGSSQKLLNIARDWAYNPSPTTNADKGLYFVSKSTTATVTGTVKQVQTFNTAHPTIEQEVEKGSSGLKWYTNTWNDSTRFPTYTDANGVKAPITTAITVQFPSGISTTTSGACPGSNMTCATQQAILDHASNPANVWRAAHPYNSYKSYLGITVGSPADTTPPTLTGSLSSSNITSTGFTLSWPAASDNVGVTGYEYSLNGGTSYTDVGNVLTKAITGLTASTSYSVKLRAYDAAGNRSTPPLSTTITTQAAAVVTPKLVQTIATYRTSGAGDMTDTFSTAPKPGDLLYLVADRNGGAPPTLGSAMSGWTSLPNSPTSDIDDGGNGAIISWYKIAGSSDPATVTVNSSNGVIDLVAYEFSGVQTPSPLDAANSLITDPIGSAANFAWTSTGLLSKPDSVVIATCHLGNDFSAPIAPSGFKLAVSSGSRRVISAYKVTVSNTALTGLVTSWTTSVSSRNGIMQVFKGN